MPKQPQELIAQIELAFANVTYPGDDDLTDSTVGDEPAALVAEFRGKTDWRELDVTFLNLAPDGFGTALAFFSGNALRFYLPAYMIADLRGELDTFDPTTRLCSAVTPLGGKQKIAKKWGGGTMGERARADFAKFDSAQVSAVVAYLWWKLGEAGGRDMIIEEALENYWLVREADARA